MGDFLQRVAGAVVTDSTSESLDFHAQSPATVAPIVRPEKRIRLWFRIGLFSLIGAVALMEFVAIGCRNQSVSRLKGIARNRTRHAPLTLAEVESQIVGWPIRKESLLDKSKLVVFTWPSLTGLSLIRAKVNAQGSVLKMDNQSVLDDDFHMPFFSWGTEGVTILDKPPATSKEQFEQELSELRNQARSVFSRPLTQLPSGLVIFPIVDEQRRITTTGTAISLIAQNSVISTPKRRMALEASIVRQTLLETDTWHGGTILDQTRIDRCLNNIRVFNYVLPKLASKDDRSQIVLEIHGPMHTSTSSLTVDVSKSELNLIPGMIALQLLDFLKIPLSPEERSWIATPQFSNNAQAENFVCLADLAQTDFFAHGQFQREVLAKNPHWVAAWDLYGDVRNFTGLQSDNLISTEAKQCSTIARHLLVREVNKQFALRRALTLLPEGEVSLATVARLAKNLQNEKALLNDVLTYWRANDNSYQAHLDRSRLMLDRSWATGAERMSATQTKKLIAERKELLAKVHQELEQALVINRGGWQAHGEMVNLAISNGASFDVLQNHFLAATRFAPKYYEVWEFKRDFLQQRKRADEGGWNLGESVSDAQLYQFVDECLANGHWTRKIPQIAIELLTSMAFDSQYYARKLEVTRSPEFWTRLQLYYQGAKQQPDRDTRRKALNYFALQAALSGHYVEAVPAFEQLDKETIIPQSPEEAKLWAPGIKTEFLEEVFESDARYFQLRDLVRAHTREDTTGLLSRTRVALLNFRLDEAGQALSALNPTTEEEVSETERLQRALAFGHRLTVDRKILLGPRDCLELFAEVGRLSCQGLSGNPRWKASDDGLSYSQPQFNAESGWVSHAVIYFPLGLRNATMKGEMNYTGQTQLIKLMTRSQAFRIRTELLLRPQALEVILARGNVTVLQDKLTPKPYQFQVRYTPEKDWLSPCPTVEFHAIVLQDSPGEFGLGIWGAGKEELQLLLSNFSVELTK